jgi:flagellar basal body rod protein FlgF
VTDIQSMAGVLETHHINAIKELENLRRDQHKFSLESHTISSAGRQIGLALDAIGLLVERITKLENRTI